MTKVKINQSVAGVDFSYQPGDEPELYDELANAWHESGIATKINCAEVCTPKKPAKGNTKAVVAPVVEETATDATDKGE